MTYFSYDGPTTIETSFTNTPQTKSKSRRDKTVKEMDTVKSETVDNASTLSIRPRPLYDPQGMILVAPPYPGPDYTGYMPFAQPFDPMTRPQWTDMYDPRYIRNSYKPVKTFNMRLVVIIMAVLFLAALITAIFMAIYFGHKY